MRSIKHIFFSLSVLLLFSAVGNSKELANICYSKKTQSQLLILKSEPVFKCILSNASFHIKDDLRIKDMDQDSDDYFITPHVYSEGSLSQINTTVLSVFQTTMTCSVCVNPLRLYILFHSLNIP